MIAPRSWWLVTGVAALVYSLRAVGPVGWFAGFILLLTVLALWPVLLAAAGLYVLGRLAAWWYRKRLQRSERRWRQ